MFTSRELELLRDCVIVSLLHMPTTPPEKDELNDLYIKIIRSKAKILPKRIIRS
jgi:hypothetical protein